MGMNELIRCLRKKKVYLQDEEEEDQSINTSKNSEKEYRRGKREQKDPAN